MGDRFHEMTWRLERNAEDHAERSVGGGRPTESDEVQFLDLEEWEALLQTLAEFDVHPAEVLASAFDSFDSMKGPPTVHGPTARPLPLGRFGAVKESDDSFSVTAILARTSDSIRTATVSWDKVPFDAWWAEERTMVPSALDAPAGPYSSIVPPGAPCTDDTWLPTMQAVPRPRCRHSAVWTGSEMIVWGGLDFDGVKNSGGRYDPSTDTWSSMSAGAGVPSARKDHTAVWTGTEMIVWGGEPTYDVMTNTGGRYDPASDSWIPTGTGGAPVPRAGHTAVWTGSLMIVWGGRASPTQRLSSGGRYDPVSNLWTPTSTAGVPSAREIHTAVWTGAEMIVWGGWPIQDNSGSRYNLSSDTWAATSTGANAPTYRRGHSAVWTGTEMIVWGGEQVGINRTNAGARYRPTTNTWEPTSTLPGVPDPRAFHTAVWTGTHMVVWGGVNQTYMNTGGRFDPATDTWSPTSVGGTTPAVRLLHTAVWTGADMIVWGGLTPGGVLDTGGVYQPTPDTWTPTSTVEITAGRSRHTAVWTGSEMIVWGGGTSTVVSNSGDRYNPASDTWATTSTGTNVPSPRYYHTAVWTGSEMIVWGGEAPDGTYLDTGARYAPAANTWTPTGPGLALPSPRSEHTAVWTGTDMVIWGGAGAGGYSNTGSRYRPSIDAWTGTASGAIPSARKGHTAVWTGREMIVWGGYAGQSLNTGGRYDPASNAWSPTSVGANVPTPRHAHSAVWTGREMIVWGGYPVVATGGRYDLLPPCSLCPNVWRRTSGPGDATAARELHTAVWTGSEMIVWGGQDPPSHLLSGGRYCADVVWIYPPGEVTDLAWTPGTRTSLEWSPVDGAESYEVDSGTAGTLPRLLTPERDSCQVAGGPGTTTGEILTGNPGPGSLLWYLVRAANDAGFGPPGDATAGPRILDPHGCGDGNPCTSDSCEPSIGCGGHTPNSDPCDDANACTTNDVCGGGACIGGAPLDCNDGDLCTSDTCSPASGCVHTDISASCDDGNVCTTDSCSPSQGCSQVANTLACSDGNACTAPDTCSGGQCVGGPPITCTDDGNLCTTDTCNPSSGCVHTPNTDPCNDGNPCTPGDSCGGGVCQGHPPSLLISQIQVEGDGSTPAMDEFIELYNAYAFSINPWGSYWVRYTNGGPTSTPLTFALPNLEIPSHGWLLIARPEYNGSTPPDATYSNFSLAAAGGDVFLVVPPAHPPGAVCLSTSEIIDRVGYGTGNCAESAPVAVPGSNDSVNRRPGGACGLYQDTNNNAADFVLQSPSTPRNRFSPPAP